MKKCLYLRFIKFKHLKIGSLLEQLFHCDFTFQFVPHKEELENRMERISGTLLIGTQMFSQLQQRQCIAEATAKEQQCLVDYFDQLRPKRWQEWERKYNGLSTAQYIFLIMQDDLHFDDETIAAILAVKRVSVRSMRARIKKSER